MPQNKWSIRYVWLGIAISYNWLLISYYFYRNLLAYCTWKTALWSSSTCSSISTSWETASWKVKSCGETSSSYNKQSQCCDYEFKTAGNICKFKLKTIMLDKFQEIKIMYQNPQVLHLLLLLNPNVIQYSAMTLFQMRHHQPQCEWGLWHKS